MSKHLSIIGLITLITTILFISCSSTEQHEVVNPFDGVPEIEISEWLDINDESTPNSADFYFSSNYFHHMIIDNNGNYFVYNRGSEPIFYFDKNGEYITSVGRRGQGPGEFQSWPTFDTALSDTLYTLDRVARIVSRFVYRNEEWRYDDSFTLQDKEEYSPSKILQIDREHLIIEFTPDVSRLMNVSDNSSQASKKYNLLKISGETIKDNWLETPAHERSIYSSSAGARAIHLLPFGGRSIVKVGPHNHLYHLWTPEFSINIYDFDGKSLKKMTHPSFNYNLSDELRRKRVDEVVGVRMGSEREQQELLTQMFEETPTEAPALRDFHIDRDNGYIIVRRYIFKDQPNWMLLDNKGNRVGVFTLDENLTVFDFRNGKIIGALNNENELPTVRIVTLPQSVL